jgi:hypothetical protein
MLKLFWRVADQLDYLLTLARLRILDAVCGPLPETRADQRRRHDRERIGRAFPNRGKPYHGSAAVSEAKDSSSSILARSEMQ